MSDLIVMSLVLFTILFVGGFFWLYVNTESAIREDVIDFDEIKPLEQWSDKEFIEWKFEQDKGGRFSFVSKKSIKRAKKIIRARNKELEKLEQKEDEQQALEAWNKLENTLKEHGYR